MDGESLDSEREPRRRGGAQDPDIIVELEQGELHPGNFGGFSWQWVWIQLGQ
jgi:hypothetical protein